MVNHPSRYGLLLALSVALLAPTARAQQAPPRERLALHPCVITGGDKSNAVAKKSAGGKKGAATKKPDIAELEAVCATAAIRDTMNLVPSTDVRAFLDKEAHGSCAKAQNRNMCLGKLAAATKASRTLYLTLDPFNPKVTHITGLVVDESGNKIEEKPLDLPRLPNQPAGDVIRIAVSQILDRLDTTKPTPLELVPVPGGQPDLPLLATQPNPTATPAPSPTVTAPPSAPVASVRQEAHHRTWKTPAGITGMALGGVGLIASGVLVTSANSKAKEFNDAFKDGLPPSAETARLAKLRDDAKSQQSLAAISAGAGAALAVGGLVLWLTDGSSSSESASSHPKVGTTRILAGPGQVGVLVWLP
ncbi:MAG: hypothetical protein ACJ8AT_18665 [Hyalangium sp.]|uniref:hypothetical protein n=1 Tax=Hyalangium sp. TaxID=2028555 RepID=UPI003899A450